MESPRKDSHFYREALRTILPEGGEWHCMLGPFGSCVGLELVHREAVPRRGLKLLCVSGIGGGVSSLFCCPLWGRKGHLTKFAPETPHCELMYIMSFNLFDEPRR